jgi:hypothetical protein
MNLAAHTRPPAQILNPDSLHLAAPFCLLGRDAS